MEKYNKIIDFGGNDLESQCCIITPDWLDCKSSLKKTLKYSYKKSGPRGIPEKIERLKLTNESRSLTIF